jgi:hypothetical protein
VRLAAQKAVEIRVLVQGCGRRQVGGQRAAQQQVRRFE